MKLSNNFSLKEMVASQTAERKGINNNPSEDQLNNLNISYKLRNLVSKVVNHIQYFSKTF